MKIVTQCLSGISKACSRCNIGSILYPPSSMFGIVRHTDHVCFVFVSGEGSLNDIWLLEGDVSAADDTPSAGGCGSADFNLIALHGIFMFLGWGVLLQAGAFIARYFRHIEPEGWWFKMHRIFQVSRSESLTVLHSQQWPSSAWVLGISESFFLDIRELPLIIRELPLRWICSIKRMEAIMTEFIW